MTPRLETSSQGDLEMSRVEFPERQSLQTSVCTGQSRVQTHSNFLATLQRQMNDEPTDCQLLCEVSSNRIFSRGQPNPGGTEATWTVF